MFMKKIIKIIIIYDLRQANTYFGCKSYNFIRMSYYV